MIVDDVISTGHLEPLLDKQSMGVILHDVIAIEKAMGGRDSIASARNGR